MEKSALKELVERLVGKGISESQTDLFPKLRGGQHDRGNDTIVYRETKKALRRVVNTLPDNITSEADIKPVCDFLDTVRFGRINDAQFSNSLRRLIAEGRKKFAIALQSQTRKSVMPGHAGEGLAAQTGSSPTKPEDQKTIEMSGALYEQFVYQAIAGCFELYEQFLKNLFANSAASDAPLKREDVKTRIDDVKAALTEASFRIKDSIITQNPAERILGSKEKKVVIPKEEIGAIISETVLIMGNIMPIEINREAAEPLIAAFLTAHVPAHITVPRAISEKERDDLQNPELRDYLIDDVAHNSLRQALVQTRKNLLPEEKEVFIALVLDHISEKLPKVVPQERAINDYFHS
ncbi:MAG TPA: hypothetical protein VI588_03780, partial [Candidatus Gracilibacteria bacterium]|nr:hypothetical protein [Candidatus Gracilibacteria bacterium]